MSRLSPDLPDRLLELVADRAMIGLSADDATELSNWSNDDLDGDLEQELLLAELAAALGHEALLDVARLEAMPPGVAAGILQSAPGKLVMTAAPDRDLATFVSPRPRWKSSWSLLAAAAVILIVIGGLRFLVDESSSLQPLPSLQARLEALERDAGDLVSARWNTVKEGHPVVTGRVVWSSDRQEGYMVLEGLPTNDPRQAQYQLWIVDPGRDREPVDGGVFDVDGQGTIVVPIAAKLRVTDPQAFVITSEQPGGVVVSEGPHLVLAAR